MGYGISRSDKTGYRERKSVVLQLELTEDGICRPNINGKWHTQPPLPPSLTPVGPLE